MKRLAPSIPAGLLVVSGGNRPTPWPREGAPCGLLRAAPFAGDARSPADDARGGIPVVTWTVNDPADMRRLMVAGLGTLPGDGMISDFPDRLVNLRGTRQ